MRFAHLADAHLGGWKEPKIQELGSRAFQKAVDICIEEQVDFVLLAGDLFNTSMPGIDALKLAVIELKRLKEENIPVYMIAGSHDFSPSGKTMLDVLEEAGLFINVCKGDVAGEALRLRFTADPKTGAKITGMLGKKGQLDKKYYESLIREELEEEEGFKIFMFHTALTELKTKELEKMESQPVSLMPKGFDYYAGGHVHIVREYSIEGYANVVYPGPVFPNSFSEMEKLRCGGLYIYDDGELRFREISPVGVMAVQVDAEHKTPEKVVSEIIDAVNNDLSGNLVLIRVAGTLETGKVSDVNFKRIFELCSENGAYFVMKNTNRLRTREYEEVKVQAGTSEEAEQLVIEQNIGQVKALSLNAEREKELVSRLMQAMDTEKNEGEKTADFEGRILSDIEKVFDEY